MSNDLSFELVGIKTNIIEKENEKGKKICSFKGKPFLSIGVFSFIVLGCLLSELLMNHVPTYLDLAHFNEAPSREYYFGTDMLGRDIYSMIWFGGRASIFIGLFATLISTILAITYGALSGMASRTIDNMMMRFTEILLSIPSILIIIFIQAVIGKQNALAIAFVIGITSWMSIAKIVRTEVKQIRSCEYVLISRCMGGGFFHILKNHLAPNFVSSIMFMVVMNISGAIAAESTLSFLGIGLPPEIITWGSMLSLADKALLTNSWWIIVVPGTYLITTLVCITNIGNYIRKLINNKQRNL